MGDAAASTIIPLGLHVTSSGSLGFDNDPWIADDLRSLIHGFAAMKETVKRETGRDLKGTIKDLPSQRDMLNGLVEKFLVEMDGGGLVDHGLMDRLPASAFSRFPAFCDFSELARGCGDLEADPAHPKRKLADETQLDHTRQED